VIVADMSSLAADLEALLEGALTEDDFRLRYQSGPPSRVVAVIRGNLEHYLADADIRARDPEYRAMQNGELLKLIRLLRADAPTTQLQRINFLRRS
jgi:hypothetical protein